MRFIRRRFIAVYERDIKSRTSRSALEYIVGRYIGNSRPLDLHNGGNDAHWEAWCIFLAIEQGLGLTGYADMRR